jgi:hypothetical protein
VDPVRWRRPAGVRLPQCTKLDPGAVLRPQTAHSFDCLDAASPSRIHSSACLRSISRAKGSSAFSAAWRQSLAWCSHNSTCDDIGPTSCGHLIPAGGQVAQSRRECPFVARSAECVQSPFLDFSTARIALKKSLLAAKCNTKTPRKVFSRLCGAGATINEWREAGAWPRLLRLCLKRGCRLGPLAPD